MLDNPALETVPTPPPGSAEAVALGCQCPPYGNHQGKGLRGNGAKWGWYVSDDCELHREWTQRGRARLASADAVNAWVRFACAAMTSRGIAAEAAREADVALVELEARMEGKHG